jgi:hypothetical protein
MMILLSFLALIPRILLGYLLTEIIWKTSSRKHFLIKVFISGPLGFGVSSLLAFLWIWIGLPLSLYVFTEGLIVLCITAWVLIKNHTRLLETRKLLTGQHFSPWIFLLIAGCVLFVVDLVFTALQNPHGKVDAWAQWNVVARFIYLGGSNWQGTFLRPTHHHPDYPLFLAVANAITWSVTKRATVWGPIAFHFSVAFFMAGLVFSLLNTLKSFKQAILATIVLMAQPIVARTGMSQMADALIAYFLLAIGGFIVLYHSTREKGVAIIAGILTGLICWVKNEGLIPVISCTIIWVMIALRGDRMALKNYLMGLAFPLFVVVLFKIFLAPTSDLVTDIGQIIEKAQNVERYVYIAGQAGKMIWGIGFGPLSIVGLLLIYSILVGGTKTFPSGIWAVTMIILLQWAAYFGIYLITSYPLEWHISTSMIRVLYHTFPLALFLVFLYLRTPEELHS